MTARTVNVETVTFYAVLKFAVDRGMIQSFSRVKQLRQKPPPKRPLLAPDDVERLLRHCIPDAPKNADLLKFYLRFLALTGAREKEALRIRWADVDSDKRLVTIGADAASKSGHHRTVNFTPELDILVKEMTATRPSDSSFLFPSPHASRRTFPPIDPLIDAWQCRRECVRHRSLHIDKDNAIASVQWLCTEEEHTPFQWL